MNEIEAAAIRAMLNALVGRLGLSYALIVVGRDQQAESFSVSRTKVDSEVVEAIATIFERGMRENEIPVTLAD